MKIVVAATRFPYPPKKGDSVQLLNRIIGLAREHQVTLLCINDRPLEPAQARFMENLGVQVRVVQRSKVRAALSALVGFFFQGLPAQIGYFDSGKFKSALGALVAEKKPDLLHVFLLRTPTVPLRPQVPMSLEFMDAFSLIADRRAKASRGLQARFWAIEARRMARLEADARQRFGLRFIISQIDRDALGDRDVKVVPGGVDAQVFSPVPGVSRVPARVVFCGNMSYHPNILAMDWFLANCWQRIKAARPEAQMYVVGRDPPRPLQRRHADPSVVFTGEVESVLPELCKASVVVAPMRSGAGMQNKVLEAMSCELPVVCTSLGLGAIAARHGEEVWVADEPQTFADGVLKLLADDALARRLSRNARSFVLEHHDWAAINHAASEHMRRYVESAARGKR